MSLSRDACGSQTRSGEAGIGGLPVFLSIGQTVYHASGVSLENKMAANMVNRVVMPGDVLGSIKDIQQQSDTKNTKLRLGPGLRQEKDTVIAFKSGVNQMPVERLHLSSLNGVCATTHSRQDYP